MNDAIRLMNDLHTVVSIIDPDIDETKLMLRLEETLSNYHIEKKSELEVENDLPEKMEIFLSAKQLEGLSKQTLKGYVIELSLFSNHTKKAVAQITTTDIRQYLSSNPDWMAGTIERKLSVLKTFFGWLVQEELLLHNPAAKIKSPKKPKRLPKWLSVEELEIVRESCETLRERALIEVLYSTGARLAELINMQFDDMNLPTSSIKVIGKGDKERNVFLSPKARHHLNKYIDSRSDDCPYIFVTERRPFRKMTGRTVERIINKVEKRANIKTKLTPHVFRHSFASLAMENNIELADLQHLLGHSNPATTLIYASVSDERKYQAFKKYHVQ